MEKLIYTKIGEDTLSVNIQNGYSIIAIKAFNHDKKKYEVTFYIKDNNIDMWDLMEEQEKVEFNATYKTINSAILKHVATVLYAGGFDRYVKRYEYQQACFDRGDELFKKERLNNVS